MWRRFVLLVIKLALGTAITFHGNVVNLVGGHLKLFEVLLRFDIAAACKYRLAIYVFIYRLLAGCKSRHVSALP